LERLNGEKKKTCQGMGGKKKKRERFGFRKKKKKKKKERGKELWMREIRIAERAEGGEKTKLVKVKKKGGKKPHQDFITGKARVQKKNQNKRWDKARKNIFFLEVHWARTR